MVGLWIYLRSLLIYLYLICCKVNQSKMHLFCLDRLNFCSERSQNLKTLPAGWQGKLSIWQQNIAVNWITDSRPADLGHSHSINNLNYDLFLVGIWAILPVEWVVTFWDFGATTQISQSCFSLLVSCLEAWDLLWWGTNTSTPIKLFITVSDTMIY